MNFFPLKIILLYGWFYYINTGLYEMHICLLFLIDFTFLFLVVNSQRISQNIHLYIKTDLYSVGWVHLDPFDDSLIDKLLSLGVEAIVGQVADQVFFRDAEDLVLASHVWEVLQGKCLSHVVQLCATHSFSHSQDPQAVPCC